MWRDVKCWRRDVVIWWDNLACVKISLEELMLRVFIYFVRSEYV